MADTAKYAPLNGGTLITHLKSHFSLLRNNKRNKGVNCAYGFVSVFIVFTIFLAFTPSQNSSSPWFTSVFITSFSSSSHSNGTATDSDISDESYRSHFSSVFSYLFPNTSAQVHSNDSSVFSSGSPENTTELPNFKKDGNFMPNSSLPPQPSSEISEGSPNLEGETQSKELDSRGEAFVANQTTNSSPESFSGEKNATGNGGISISEKGVMENATSLSNKSLMNCDLYDGNWARDETYPLYEPGSCSLIDEQFNCFSNGRPDHDYYKLKWKPNGCTLPRLNGTHMLELLRGRRLAFVGDSLNRNMWESLICILKNSVQDQKKVYEESGRHNFRGEASYAFIFEEYKCKVEFYMSPFLVQEWEFAERNGTKKETLRLDLIESIADRYKTADVIIFNTGHWWTHEKTSKGKDYYQEGSHVYSELNVLEAFRRALTTWARWVDNNINPVRTHVMFRGYSETHFSGGQWNSGGQCDSETEPITEERYLVPYSSKMVVFEEVMRGMKTNVSYLNITRLTDYRKDGHPSIYRKRNLTDKERKSQITFQDCSHWCLPGVPDAWNELLYAELLVEHMKKNQS